jgi:hypothetical protein
MLKKLALVIAFSALSAGVVYAAGGAGTGVVGSMHDINVAGGGTYQQDKYERVCVFCHTPHNAQPNGAIAAPLWNHDPSTVNNLDPYNWSSPANGTLAFDADPLVGPSRLCMACHDGVTAVDSHGTAGSQTGSTPLRSEYTDALGATAKRYIDDLTVTHPIGFKYDEAAALRGSGEVVPSSQGFIASEVTADFNTNDRGGLTYTPKKIQDTLYTGYMTCASCHDVHNSVNAVPDPGNNYNYFLYAKQEGSAICLSCHVK